LIFPNNILSRKKANCRGKLKASKWTNSILDCII